MSEKTELTLMDDLLSENEKLREENIYFRNEVAQLMTTLNKSCISSGKVIHGLRGTIAALQEKVRVLQTGNISSQRTDVVVESLPTSAESVAVPER